VVRLIVNGDDFGTSPGINGAVVRAFRHGILTSCSLMVGGRSFPEAVKAAGETEGLAVGLHLVAVKGWSVLPPDRIPQLVNRQGRFGVSPFRTGLVYFCSKRCRRGLDLELRAQFERFLSTGLPMSHVDSHLHFHLHPVIFRLAVNLCKEYGVRRMRVPEDDPDLLAGFKGGIRLPEKLMSRLFHLFVRRMKAELRDEGFVYPKRVFGNLMTGRMERDYVLYLLDHLSEGDYEVYFHPDESSEDSAPAMQRKRELEILLDPAVKSRIEERGIELIHYGHLSRVT